jgi:mono/diheme cytochrome c family protein
MKNRWIIIALSLFLYHCESSTFEEISEDVIPIEDTIRYTTHTKIIFEENCIVCHSPGAEAAFRPLTNYNEVRTAVLETNLLERIQLPNGDPNLMPKPGRMPQDKINMILQWQEDGLLE